MTSPISEPSGEASAVHVARWLPFAVALIVATILTSMLWLQGNAQEEFIARDRQTQMKLVGGTLAGAFDQAGKFASALAEANARRAEVAAALAAGDRARLLALSQSGYDYLSRQAGVQIYGYHTRDLRYLLRMHRLEASGDDISGFRPMIVAANRAKRPQAGIEIGIAGIGIRGVALVNDGGDFAGTAEIGLDLRPLLELVKASTNADLAVIVAPAVAGVALDPKLPSFGELTLAASTDDALFSALMQATKLRPLRDTMIGRQTIGDRHYSMITQPLVDFSGRFVGMTLALKPHAASESRRLGTELWVVAICGGILAFIAFAVLLRVAARREKALS